MPVLLDWLDVEESIVLYRYEGHWTWEEWFCKTEEFLAAALAENRPIALIGDHRNKAHFPLGSLDILEYVRTIGIPANIETIILIGLKGFPLQLIQLAQRLYPALGMRYQLAPNLEEALVMIHKTRMLHAH